MRNISPMATAIVLLFMTNAVAEQANTDQQVYGTTSSHGLDNYECDLVDTHFEADMTKIEIYYCLERGYSLPVKRNSVRVTYTKGIQSIGPLPKPGDAPAIVSKTP